jgi:hypothetical protein
MVSISVLAVLAVVAVLVRPVVEPEFRVRMADWRFVGIGLLAMGLGSVVVYLVSALVMWPALSRTRQRREMARE